MLPSSEIWRLAGRGKEAWQHARQALDLARQQKARGDEVLALHQLGVVYAHADPPDAEQAEAHYQLARAEELGMHPLQAHVTTARAALSIAIALYCYGTARRDKVHCTHTDAGILPGTASDSKLVTSWPEDFLWSRHSVRPNRPAGAARTLGQHRDSFV